MTFELWTAFAAASLVIALVPGPGVASIVGFAVASGRRTALASVAGMAVGNAAAVSVSLAGAGIVLAGSATAFAVLKWIGAAYLIGIGTIAILKSGGAASLAGDAAPIRPRTAFLTNVAVGTFHPKTIVFFVSFAAQFVDPSRPFVPQAALLVATFTGIAAATDTLYALLASRAASLLARPGARRWLQRAGGGALVIAGLATAAMRR